MIEFLFNKEFLLIVIGCLIMGVGMYISDWRRKKQEERQARLNSIRLNDMTKKEIINELRAILKDYHYKSDVQHMSKDVVVSLENLLGSLLRQQNSQS